MNNDTKYRQASVIRKGKYIIVFHQSFVFTICQSVNFVSIFEQLCVVYIARLIGTNDDLYIEGTQEKFYHECIAHCCIRHTHYLVLYLLIYLVLLL